MTSTFEGVRLNHAALELMDRQQASLLADVDANRVPKKSEILGRVFEESVRKFIAELLPRTMSVVSGFIVGEDLEESSHLDAIIIDTRYPYLGVTGSQHYVMAASVLAVIELTTHLDKRKLDSVLGKAKEAVRLSTEHYEAESFVFFALCADSLLQEGAELNSFSPASGIGHIYALRHGPTSYGMAYTLKDGTISRRETVSPLAEFIQTLIFTSLYELSARESLDGVVVDYEKYLLR